MSSPKRSGLGRGIASLIPETNPEPIVSDESILMVSIADIQPNPHQPRTEFKDAELQELSESIQAHGIIQPLILTPDDEASGKYYLIAGERRLRAAEIAGLKMVPGIVRSASEQERLELALIENVQRSDLSPLETAEAYRSLEENFNLTHEEIAKRVGKNRSSITNTLRLLKLPEIVRKALAEAVISEGHARALLGLPNETSQLAALQAVIKQELNVRQTEALVRKLNGQDKPKPNKPAPSPEQVSIEETLMRLIGTKVSLHPGKNGGTIHIHYYSNEELDDLISRFSSFS